MFGEMLLRSCLVCVQCREAVLHCGRAPDEMRGSWDFSIGICYCCLVVLLFPDPVHFGWLGVRGEWRPRGSFSGTAGSSEGGDRERQGCVWLYCFPAAKKWCDYCFLVSYIDRLLGTVIRVRIGAIECSHRFLLKQCYINQ